MSTGAAVVVPPSGGGGGGFLAGDVSGPLLANVINNGVVTSPKIALVTVTGGGPGGNIAPNTITSYNIVPGSITPDSLASGMVDMENSLTNPGFNIMQLYDPTIANTVPDNTICFDAWKLNYDTANVSFQRKTSAGTGWAAANFARFTKTAAAGKFMVYQPLESLTTRGFQSKPYLLAIKLNLPAPKQMRMGFFFYTGVAPNDVVPQPVAPGNWNGFGVAPTLNPGFAYGVNFSFAAPAGFSIWVIFSGGGAIGANDTLCPFVCTDESFGVGNFFDLSETQMNPGTSTQFLWRPLPEAEDIMRCQRFIEKSYDIDTIPGMVTDVGAQSFNAGGPTPLFTMPLQRKVRTPTPLEVNFYSPSSGAAGNWFDINTILDVPVLPDVPSLGQRSMNLSAPSSGDQLKGHFLVNTSL